MLGLDILRTCNTTRGCCSTSLPEAAMRRLSCTTWLMVSLFHRTPPWSSRRLVKQAGGAPTVRAPSPSLATYSGTSRCTPARSPSVVPGAASATPAGTTSGITLEGSTVPARPRPQPSTRGLPQPPTPSHAFPNSWHPPASQHSLHHRQTMLRSVTPEAMKHWSRCRGPP